MFKYQKNKRYKNQIKNQIFSHIILILLNNDKFWSNAIE